MGAAARGRPRSEAVDDAILAAAVTCLANDGYDGLTFSAVSEMAGVGRPTVYRRYGSRAELAVAALMSLSEQREVALPTDTQAAIGELLQATAHALASPGALTILGSMLARERRDPALLATFRRAVFEPRHAIVRDVIRTGIERGQVRESTDVDVVIDLLFGSLLARALSAGDIDGEYVSRVIDSVWTAIKEDRA